MATLRDVAKHAGVSLATASRALNGTPNRQDARATQARVLAAVRELHYVPNETARLLGRSGRGAAQATGAREVGLKNIGLVLGNVSYKFTDPFWSVVFDGVDRETTRKGHHLRFAFTLDDLAHRHQGMLLHRDHIDGLILVGGHDSVTAMAQLGDWLNDEAARTRTVIIDGGDERFYRQRPLEYDVVSFEKRHAIYQMVDHLVAHGHRHLAFLGATTERDERGAAFLQALTLHDLPSEPALFVACPWSTEGAYPVAQALFQAGQPVDAIICGCDAIAISVIRAAREAGRQIPQDVAIVGFDDIAFAQHLHPALTTIHVEKAMLGEVAVRRLIERLQEPELPPLVQVVPSTLIVRDSCGMHEVA